MTVELIIFDFDGTIANTFDAIVQITNRLATQFGYQPTNRDEIAQLQNLSSRRIIEISGVSIFKLPFLVRKVKAELQNEMQTVEAFPGIKVALTELKRRGYKLAIISSNSRDNIGIFLTNNELEDLFDYIYTGAKLFGKSKIINRLLKQENILPETVIYVGDETRDMEAAIQSQVRAIAVSWGFNSPEVLAAQNPNFLIQHPGELIDIVASSQEAESSK